MNASDLMKLLQVRYAPPSWAVLREVRDGTGYATAGRSADAMAFGLWPSRGLEIHGFELKVYRGDWLRELKQPEKCESFYKYVDRWWVVAGDDSVIKAEEVPVTWGLLVAKGEKLFVRKEAPAKKAIPVNRLFLMAIIRRLADAYVPKSVFEERVTEEVAKRVETAVESATFGREAIKREAEELKARLKTFEERSGVRIGEWNAERIGDAVRVVTEHGPEAILEQYGYLSRRMRELGAQIDKTVASARERLSALNGGRKMIEVEVSVDD